MDNQQSTGQQFTDRPQESKEINVNVQSVVVTTLNLDYTVLGWWMFIGHNIEGIFHGW